MLTVYLARHGQTDWNKAKRLQGWTDIPLNETGRGQAENLARRLSGVPLDSIFTSNLSRARATAGALEGRAPVTIDEGLRERCMGAFEGFSVDGSDPERQEEFLRRKHAAGDDLDGGETIEGFRERVVSTVDRIVAGHPAGTILIVGHGATNSMVVGRFLQLSIPEIAKLWFANDDLYRIESPDGETGRVWKEIGGSETLRFWRQ
ncbi:MAG: histidine phosphatase family protein [Myxococcota bacterium]